MSRRGERWYSREPRAFLEGVRHLTEREIAVYAIVLDLIYDGAGETYDDPKHIASYFSDLGSAAVRNAINKLVEAGKLVRCDGHLTNCRAKNEVKTQKELAENRRKRRRSYHVSPEFSDSNSNENNGLTQKSTPHITEHYKTEQRKEEDGAADAASTSSRYAFAAKTIKLTEEHLEQWRRNCPSIRLEAELMAMDEWAATKGKNWFNAVSGLLAKKEREAFERIQMRKLEISTPKPPPRQHIDGRI